MGVCSYLELVIERHSFVVFSRAVPFPMSFCSSSQGFNDGAERFVMVFLKDPRTIVPRCIFHTAKAPKLVVSARIPTFTSFDFSVS